MNCIDNGGSERLLTVGRLIDWAAGYFDYDAVRLTYRYLPYLTLKYLNSTVLD